MGGCEPSDGTTVCAEADANATASKTSTVNGALATLPLLRGCARRVGLLLTGITYEKARGKWRAWAGTSEFRYHVGRYETEEEAAAALRAEQEQERRRGAELEDPIDRMCEQFPDDVAQAQRLQKKLAEHVRHLLRPQQEGPAQVAHAAEADE